jgi:hypothetical protein
MSKKKLNIEDIPVADPKPEREIKLLYALQSSMSRYGNDWLLATWGFSPDEVCPKGGLWKPLDMEYVLGLNVVSLCRGHDPIVEIEYVWVR